MLDGSRDIEKALEAVGDILEARGEKYAIVVVGGSALNLLGIVARTTRDVDVIALGEPADAERPTLLEPEKALPAALANAATIVAREMNLLENWMNTGPALQWKQGMPPGLSDRVVWRQFGGLSVGLVDRLDLVYFKLYAAADSTGPSSVHYQDLVALAPSANELNAAMEWVQGQDVSPEFHSIVDQVVAHVKDNA